MESEEPLEESEYKIGGYSPEDFPKEEYKPNKSKEYEGTED